MLILRAASSPAHDAGLSVPDWPTSYGWNMLSMTVAIALFTSPGWNADTPKSTTRVCATRPPPTTVAIYAAILVGATMRHPGAGLAIPDFP